MAAALRVALLEILARETDPLPVGFLAKRLGLPVDIVQAQLLILDLTGRVALSSDDSVTRARITAVGREQLDACLRAGHILESQLSMAARKVALASPGE